MTKQTLMISTFAAALLAGGGVLAADHPGQKFQISPNNLAKPYVTPGVANDSTNIPRPAGTMPEVPKGFQVSIFADNLFANKTLRRNDLVGRTSCRDAACTGFNSNFPLIHGTALRPRTLGLTATMKY